MDDLRKRVPQKHKNAWILGSIGAAIGAGIGGYFSALAHNYIYSGIGALIGYAVGVFFALIFLKDTNSIVLIKTEKLYLIILCLIGLILMTGSIIMFVRTRAGIAAVGIIISTLGELYFISKLRE